MFINGINFPNEILQAIENDELVVFAGAGVSANPPTSLPDFNKLTEQIASGTGKSLSEDEPCEVLLGHLKSEGIDVNQQAADLLSSQCLKHNKMHQAIIDLFGNTSKVRVVTTNYDHMFEQTMTELERRIPVFNAPALPLGNDMEGIVHVHGNINNPKYMVVTDEDFGKAYLTEGYATRFLEKLFQTYTVLFIGYSYNDTILRYLTRAMARNTGTKKFIMASKDTHNWETLGIVPVYYPEGDFILLRESIEKCGQMSKKGLLEWKHQFEEFSDNPPKDFTIDTEIDYCLLNVSQARVLANCIHGEEWLITLDRKDCFRNLFSNTGELSEFDEIWKMWLINNFVGTNDFLFKKLLIQKDRKMHPDLVDAIRRKVATEADHISDQKLLEYIVFLEPHIKSPFDIALFIEILSNRGLYKACQKLFEKYFDVTFILEKQIFALEESYTYKHRYKGDGSLIQASWDLCKEAFLTECPERWLYLTQNTVCELYDKYQLLKGTDGTKEPFNMVLMDLEDHGDSCKENPIFWLCHIFCYSCKSLEKMRGSFVKEFLILCMQESPTLLRKIGIKALKELETVTPNEKFDILIKNVPIYLYGAKEQIFLLVASIFNEITGDRKNHLIDLIEGRDEDSGGQIGAYEKYNWCVWIKKCCTNNDRINELEKEIRSQNNFTPREHPELDIGPIEVGWMKEESPISQTELLQLEISDVVQYLVEYNEDSFEGPSRHGLLKVFAQCCMDDWQWMVQVAQALVEKQIKNKDVWINLIQAIKESSMSADEIINSLSYLANHLDVVENVIDISIALNNLLHHKFLKDENSGYEEKSLNIVGILWDSRVECTQEYTRLIDAVSNTVLGNVLLSYIYILSYYHCDGLPDNYKTFFDKALNLKGYDREISICVLAGYFNFFCLRDYKWCIEKFNSILQGDTKEAFSAAWEGIIYFSNYLNKNVADIMAGIYLNAVKHLDWLSEEVKSGFIDLYLLLLIYVIEDPCKDYIPMFYMAASESDQKEFATRIEYRLRDADSVFKCKWWNEWLGKHLQNRFQNKPTVLKETEYVVIMNWVLELTENFDEVVDLICGYRMPQKVDFMFLHRLKESELVKRYPHKVIKLLTALLNGNTQFSCNVGDIAIIYKSVSDLSEDEIIAFQEAALKRNIRIE